MCMSVCPILDPQVFAGLCYGFYEQMLHYFKKFKSRMTAVCSCLRKCRPSVVMQLQTEAVMEHTMEIVEKLKHLGIHFNDFSGGGF